MTLEYTQRLQKLIYLYLSTDCFMKICLQSWSIKLSIEHCTTCDSRKNLNYMMLEYNKVYRYSMFRYSTLPGVKTVATSHWSIKPVRALSCTLVTFSEMNYMLCWKRIGWSRLSLCIQSFNLGIPKLHWWRHNKLATKLSVVGNL